MKQKVADWFSRIGRFHTGPRQICTRHQGDRVVGQRVIRAEPVYIPRAYLGFLQEPKETHFSWKIGEEYRTYSGRIKAFERCAYSRLLQRLPPLTVETSERNILVNILN